MHYFSSSICAKHYRMGELKMYRRNCVIILCLSLALSYIVGCGGGGESAAPATTISQPQGRPDKTWTLAILPFDTVGKYKLSGDEIMNLLIAELIDLGGYKIIDRESLQNVMNQLGLGTSDLADSSQQMQVGKVLGAQLMCVGSANDKLDLITARVNFVQSGELLMAVKNRDKNDVKNVEQIAQQLRSGLTGPKVVDFLNKSSKEFDAGSQKPGVATADLETVKVKGYGAIIDGDFALAKELALKDAYAKAIEQGCGIKLIRETLVENYQLVKDKILTESVGFVTSYEILDEDPKSEFGYEVTVSATVSKEPIPDLEKLSLTVKYLLAQPRVAVLVEGESKGEELKPGRADLIAGQIALRLQKAGFDVVDAKTIEEKKKELADSGDESAARLAGMLDANVTVRVSIAADITGRIEEIGGKKLDFPTISATTTGVVKIILADTAKVVSTLSHEDLPRGSNKGTGNTEDAAVGKSVDKFVQVISEKLAWELARQLGEPIPLRLELHGVTLEQAENFKDQLENIPEQIAIDPELMQFGDGIADYKIKAAVTSQALQQKLLKIIDPEPLDAEELVLDKVGVGSIKLSLKR